jgi:predicted nuclease of predicted toxin-antitoxin system
MQFKIDENLPNELSDLLQQAGHDATTVLGQRLGGQADSTIASVCQKEARILVTLDTDFANIQAYPPERYHGLIVLRLRRQDKPHVLSVVQRLLALLSTERLQGRLWIVEEERTRIRE